MKKPISALSFRDANGKKTELMSMKTPWSVEYEPSRDILIVRNENNLDVMSFNVTKEGETGNYSTKEDNDIYSFPGRKESLIYIDSDCLYIVEK